MLSGLEINFERKTFYEIITDFFSIETFKIFFYGLCGKFMRYCESEMLIEIICLTLGSITRKIKYFLIKRINLRYLKVK